MNDLTITFFQQDIVWGDADANRQKVEERIAVSASGTDIFVVPETFTTGFGDHMASLAEPQEGPTLQSAPGLSVKMTGVTTASTGSTPTAVSATTTKPTPSVSVANMTSSAAAPVARCLNTKGGE